MASPICMVFHKCKVIPKLISKSITPFKRKPKQKESYNFYLNYLFAAWYTFLGFPRHCFKAILLLCEIIRGEVIALWKDRFLLWSQLNMFHLFTSNKSLMSVHISVEFSFYPMWKHNTSFTSRKRCQLYKDSNLFSVSSFSTCSKCMKLLLDA